MKTTSIFTFIAVLAAGLHAAEPDLRLGEVQSVLARNLSVRTKMAEGPGIKNGADIIGSGMVKASLWGTPDTSRVMVERDDCYYDMGAPVKNEHGKSQGHYWRLGPLVAGEIQIDMPVFKGADCLQEQDLYRAEVRMMATKGAHSVKVVSKVLRTSPNLIQTLMQNLGTTPLEVRINNFSNPSDEPRSLNIYCFAGVTNGVIWNSRRNHPGLHKYSMWIGMATRVLDAGNCSFTHTPDTATVTFTIPPSKTVTVLTAVNSTGVPLTKDPADPIPPAIEGLGPVTPAHLAQLGKAHQASWDEYWLKSYIQIPSQPEMERFYYGSLYGLGASHRADNSGWAPGLVGWSTYDTKSTGWGAGHTINYNLQAIYYGIYSANRADLDEAYFRIIKPLADGYGVKEAKKAGYPGIIMPGAGAICGVVNHDNLGMKTNSAECALPLIDHWFYTRDTEFLKKAYPYLRQTADFWDAYVTLEPSGHYSIKKTPTWEGKERNENCVNAVAHVKRLYIGILEASAALGVDANRRGMWQKILNGLVDFPTRIHEGKTVFSYSTDQTDQDEPMLWPYMALPLYPVFPAQLVGLGSDPATLQAYRDTLRAFGEKRWWTHGNCGFVHTPVQAVRMGYEFSEIGKHFKKTIKTKMKPNNFCLQGGGYFETVGGIEAVNSMLLQSADGVIRIFPNWDRSDAEFYQLRAVGAFLVTASLKDNSVKKLTIVSEKGQPCRMINPWPGKKMKVRTASGKSVVVTEEKGVCGFATEPNTVYEFQ
jgi:alpha-L-fucosidase 2